MSARIRAPHSCGSLHRTKTRHGALLHLRARFFDCRIVQKTIKLHILPSQRARSHVAPLPGEIYVSVHRAYVREGSPVPTVIEIPDATNALYVQCYSSIHVHHHLCCCLGLLRPVLRATCNSIANSTLPAQLVSAHVSRSYSRQVGNIPNPLPP